MNVSVIIPSFSEPRLEKTLAALRAQTERPHEVIVVENDTVPRARERLSALYPEVIFLHEAEPGSYRARALGVRTATGEILAFLDSDCTPVLDWHRSMKATFTPGIGLVAGRVITEPDTARPNLVERYDSLTAVPQERFAARGTAAMGNLWVRRSAYDAAGGFEDMGPGRRGGFVEEVQRQGHRLAYCHDGAVSHPARRSYRSLSEKHVRIAKTRRTIHDQTGAPPLRRLRYGLEYFVPVHWIVRRLLAATGCRWPAKVMMLLMHEALRIRQALAYARGGMPPRF